ncbi:MAG TPA: DUF86 domain-containing protein [Limnochordia bacterium]|nr:DUF86 domain-containing protein [Limnochordia bacterium]
MSEPVDLTKLRRKITVIERSLRLLGTVSNRSKTEFLADDLLQSAAERQLQLAIEAMLDAANHIVARERLGVPNTYAQVFDLLVQHGFAPSDMRETLAQMARFRNRLVHLYDEIDPAQVYDIATSRRSDFERFVAALVKRYFG